LFYCDSWSRSTVWWLAPSGLLIGQFTQSALVGQTINNVKNEAPNNKPSHRQKPIKSDVESF
jgi:hypothetical protein